MELSSGEGTLPYEIPKCICYYLRVLNVALSLYSHTKEEYLLFGRSVDIVTRAFECWFDDWQKVEADFRIICSKRNYFIVYYHPDIQMRQIEMTLKAKRYLRSTIGSIKPPVFKKEHLCNQLIQTNGVQPPTQMASISSQKDNVDLPIKKKKVKKRKSSPGRPSEYTSEERKEILNARERSKVQGEKREAFIEGYALHKGMSPIDVERWLSAAERQQRRDRRKKHLGLTDSMFCPNDFS